MAETPIKDDNSKQLTQIIRLLRIVISNILLYSSSSQVVKDNLKKILVLLNEYFCKNNKFTISESDRNLLVDGKLLKSTDKGADAFVENMLVNNLKSITFKQGMTFEELNDFVAIMGIKKKERKEEISKLVTAKGITHIEVNDKVYVAVGEDGEKTETPAKNAEGLTGQDAVRLDPNEVSTAGSGRASPGFNQQGATRKETVMDAASRAVRGDRRELVGEGKRKELQSMLKELDAINRIDLANQVVDKIAENLEDEETDVRLNTVKSFKHLNPTIQNLSDKNIIEKLEDRFLATEEKEQQDEVYGELADLLEEAANRNVNEGDYEKPIRIVKMFRLHRFEKDEGFDKRWEYAENIMKKLAASGLISIIISDLRSQDHKKKEDAYTVLLSLEEYGVFALLSAIKTIEDIHLRRIIAFIIKNLGEDAVKVLVNSITVDMPSDEARRVIEILDCVDYYDIVVKELKDVFAHYNPEIRKEILSTLSRIPRANIKELIFEAFEDYDIAVRREAVKIAGKINCKEAVPVLLSYLSPEPYFSKERTDSIIQEEACAALGRMREAAAIEPLLLVALSGGSILKLQKEKPLSVRIAALFALADFKLDETKKHLGKLFGSKTPAIAKAAREAIKKQESLVANKAKDMATKIL